MTYSEIEAFLNPPKPAPEAPLPAGVDRSKLTDVEIDRQSSAYLKDILQRPGHAWNATERDAVNQGINLCLKSGL
jgi:hypothetical protein